MSKKKNKTKLANPITSLANRISTLFEGNPDYLVCFSFDENKLRIGCRKDGLPEKLASICKTHFDIGNLYLDVEFCYITQNVLDSRFSFSKRIKSKRVKDAKTFAKIWKQCFGDNICYGGIKSVTDIFGQRWWYIMGSSIVLQYDNDDELNYWGLTSTLPENVFSELLKMPRYVKLSTVKL